MTFSLSARFNCLRAGNNSTAVIGDRARLNCLNCLTFLEIEAFLALERKLMLLDSNIIIYATEPDYDAICNFIAQHGPVTSIKLDCVEIL